MSSSKLSRNLTTCTCTGVIIIAASLLFYFIKQRKRDSGGQCHKISNCLDGKFQFVQAGKVEQLYVYPIKSCKGINVSHQQQKQKIIFLVCLCEILLGHCSQFLFIFQSFLPIFIDIFLDKDTQQIKNARHFFVTIPCFNFEVLLVVHYLQQNLITISKKLKEPCSSQLKSRYEGYSLNQ